MIDHILGRPSPSWKRAQVLLVSLSWYFYLYKCDRRGPKLLRRLNEKLSKYSPFQLVAGTLACMYILKNADRLVGLGSPEPLARLYSRNYYRATWVLTAIDAGFWTAMRIKPKFLRDFMSIIFSIYYLIFADRADEKCRRIRATITVRHMRVSWEKMLNPYFRAVIKLGSPSLTIAKEIAISRPQNSAYGQAPIKVWIYYAGTVESYKNTDRIILHFPGGGFVTMPPPCHEEYLSHLTKKTGIPIVCVNYAKAPEYPYPYGLDECFDVYKSIVESNGENIGLSGWKYEDGRSKERIKISLFGDSAGGNFVAAVMCKIIESPTPLPHPCALVLIYPCLDFNITCWMPPAHVAVLRAESTGSIPSIMESKNHLRYQSPLAVVPDVKKRRWRKSFSRSIEDDESEKTIEQRIQVVDVNPPSPQNSEKTHPRTAIETRLAMTSRMSFIHDRVLTPDLMRAMAILYLGPNNYPDFRADYYLSPIVAPDKILSQFPRTYFMCGEKDPLVDDTCVFAGRIREAKRRMRQSAHGGKGGEGFRMSAADTNSSETEDVEVRLIKGQGHAFLLMMTLLPDSHGAVRAIARWFMECYEDKPFIRNTKVGNTDAHGVLRKGNAATEREATAQKSYHHDEIDKSSRPQSLHISHSLPDITIPHNNNNDAETHLHTSASEAILTPTNEREHVKWEQRHIVSETDVMKRRQKSLVKGLSLPEEFN